MGVCIGADHGDSGGLFRDPPIARIYSATNDQAVGVNYDPSMFMTPFDLQDVNRADLIAPDIVTVTPNYPTITIGFTGWYCVTVGSNWDATAVGTADDFRAMGVTRNGDTWLVAFHKPHSVAAAGPDMAATRIGRLAAGDVLHPFVMGGNAAAQINHLVDASPEMTVAYMGGTRTAVPVP